MVISKRVEADGVEKGKVRAGERSEKEAGGRGRKKEKKKERKGKKRIRSLRAREPSCAKRIAGCHPFSPDLCDFPYFGRRGPRRLVCSPPRHPPPVS